MGHKKEYLAPNNYCLSANVNGGCCAIWSIICIQWWEFNCLLINSVWEFFKPLFSAISWLFIQFTYLYCNVCESTRMWYFMQCSLPRCWLRILICLILYMYISVVLTRFIIDSPDIKDIGKYCTSSRNVEM